MRLRLKNPSMKGLKRGYVIFKGPSKLDGRPIVVIATMKSANKKTGPMVQTWVIRSRISPVRMISLGLDYTICGTCIHSANVAKQKTRNPWERDCYVNVAQAPQAVYRTFKAGKYPDISKDPAAIAALGIGREIRLGAYGDPAAVPVDVWRSLVSKANGHTGYTHQWSWHPTAAAYRDLVMASTDDETTYRDAKALGWRSFRTKQPDEPRLKGESVCPASNEAGNRVTCRECLRCDGQSSGRTLDVVIDLHGAKYSKKDVYTL